MLSFILGLLPSIFGSINNVTSAIANERLALISADTDKARINAQERINVLQSRRDVLIAESGGSKINAIIRSVIAIGPASYLLKIFLYDKVLGPWTQGTTDPLDANLWAVVTAVLGFYFLYEGAVTVTRIAKA